MIKSLPSLISKHRPPSAPINTVHHPFPIPLLSHLPSHPTNAKSSQSQRLHLHKLRQKQRNSNRKFPSLRKSPQNVPSLTFSQSNMYRALLILVFLAKFAININPFKHTPKLNF